MLNLEYSSRLQDGVRGYSEEFRITDSYGFGAWFPVRDFWNALLRKLVCVRYVVFDSDVTMVSRKLIQGYF